MEQDGLMARISTKVLTRITLDISMKTACVQPMNQRIVMTVVMLLNSCKSIMMQIYVLKINFQAHSQ